MPDPLTVGRRTAARLEEAILLALEEYRDQGYISTIRLAERIGWDAEGMRRGCHRPMAGATDVSR